MSHATQSRIRSLGSLVVTGRDGNEVSWRTEEGTLVHVASTGCCGLSFDQYGEKAASEIVRRWNMAPDLLAACRDALQERVNTVQRAYGLHATDEQVEADYLIRTLRAALARATEGGAS